MRLPVSGFGCNSEVHAFWVRTQVHRRFVAAVHANDPRSYQGEVAIVTDNLCLSGRCVFRNKVYDLETDLWEDGVFVWINSNQGSVEPRVRLIEAG